MLLHPCAGHACDNCAICQSGVCCGSAGRSTPVTGGLVFPAHQGTLADLRDALATDAQQPRRSSLWAAAEQPAAEAPGASAAALLPPPSALPPGDSDLDLLNLHVKRPRPIRRHEGEQS